MRNTGAIGSHMHTMLVTLFCPSAATVASVCVVALLMSDLYVNGWSTAASGPPHCRTASITRCAVAVSAGISGEITPSLRVTESRVPMSALINEPAWSGCFPTIFLQ